MKRIFTLLLLALFAFAAHAQTLTINPTTVKVTNGALGHYLWPVDECLITAKMSTDTQLTVRHLPTNVLVADGIDIGDLTTETADTTDALKVDFLQNIGLHFRTSTNYYNYLPKSRDVTFIYTVTGGGVLGKYSPTNLTVVDVHVDSIKNAANTANRLAYLLDTFYDN